MAITYEPIATQTLGSSQSSITFSSISGSYTDLILVINGVESDASELRYRFNDDSGTNYSFTQLFASNTSISSSRDSSRTYGRLGSTRTVRNTHIAHIMDYSNSTTYKTVLSRENTISNSGVNTGQSIVQAFIGLWRSTSAITKIVLTPETGTFNSDMTVTLYGIKEA